MSKTVIPNLNSLRGPRGRGRGRAADTFDGGGPTTVSTQVRYDAIVQETDNDAATSRQSAVNAGYLEDPFSALLHDGGPKPRRLPLMNRGTYVRTSSIDTIVDTFLSSAGDGRKQIISLGAGSDTRFFRLRHKRRKLDLVYREFDFAQNTSKKVKRLREPGFAAAAKNLAGFDTSSPDVHVSDNGTSLSSPDYTIHPQDLRDLSTSGSGLNDLDVALPTLILSECCLVYLPPDDADAVLNHFSKLFPRSTPLAIAIYEPVRPHDAFGRTMISNLATRGLQLKTLEKYHNLDQQKSRLRKFGFGDSVSVSNQGAEAADIAFIWQQWIPAPEKERVESLEWMDEVEEFVLLAKHYCTCWGWRGFSGDASWINLPGP